MSNIASVRLRGFLGGAFYGHWAGSFNNQGSSGFFWSSSAPASNANNAHNANFNATNVNPVNNNNRNNGFGVRCLLG